MQVPVLSSPGRLRPLRPLEPFCAWLAWPNGVNLKRLTPICIGSGVRLPGWQLRVAERLREIKLQCLVEEFGVVPVPCRYRCVQRIQNGLNLLVRGRGKAVAVLVMQGNRLGRDPMQLFGAAAGIRPKLLPFTNRLFERLP